jgi:hypothetical protein
MNKTSEPTGDPAFIRVNPGPQTEILTKFADVKSSRRISWTPTVRKQLESMWDRGDATPVIAAVLGCSTATVSVARARFGLKPRRAVSGRPTKQEPDEPVHKIERVAITTSRLMEFCSEKELVAQTGHEVRKWPLVIIKEGVDNSIDACEEAEIAPVVKVTIKTGKQGRRTRVIIEDNGPGIPPATITGIIDYAVRVSSKEAYISPTRGRQGNALKTILPMAYVLGGNKGETWIEARGLKHRIQFTVNQIKQEPIVHNVRGRSPVTTGTPITVFWPQHDEAVFDGDEIADLLLSYAWVNPHLTMTFTVDGKSVVDHRATNPNWTKYRACDATSAHWYSLNQIERYAGALIARDQEQRRRGTRRKYTVREFIGQFRGLSATEKQREILRELGAAHMTLARFFGSETKVDHRRMEKLLKLLQQHTRPVRPELLGVIGEEHLRHLIVDAGGEPKSLKYSASPGRDANGLPYVVEIATSPYSKWVAGRHERRGRALITGVNFSATLENPFETFKGMEGLSEILETLRAGSYAPVIVCVHYTSPHIEYLDRGKSRIGLE